MMATCLPCDAASSRIRAMAPPCHACVPGEKLSLATDIPSRIRAERISPSALAGPMVHTIFVAGSPDFPSVPRILLLRVPREALAKRPPQSSTYHSAVFAGGAKGGVAPSWGAERIARESATLGARKPGAAPQRPMA